MEVNRGPRDSSHQKVEKSKALESMLKLRIALWWFSAYHIKYGHFSIWVFCYLNHRIIHAKVDVVHRIETQAHFWVILVCTEGFPSSGKGSKHLAHKTCPLPAGKEKLGGAGVRGRGGQCLCLAGGLLWEGNPLCTEQMGLTRMTKPSLKPGPGSFLLPCKSESRHIPEPVPLAFVLVLVWLYGF